MCTELMNGIFGVRGVRLRLRKLVGPESALQYQWTVYSPHALLTENLTTSVLAKSFGGTHKSHYKRKDYGFTGAFFVFCS